MTLTFTLFLYILEEDKQKVKLNELGSQKSRQQEEHAEPYSDLLKAQKKEPLTVLRLSP